MTEIINFISTAWDGVLTFFDAIKWLQEFSEFLTGLFG